MPANEVWAVLERARREPWRTNAGPGDRFVYDGRECIAPVYGTGGMVEWGENASRRAAAIVLAINHIAALREALAPLAAAADALITVDDHDSSPLWMHPTKLTVGDVRRARAALRAMDEASRG